MDFFGIRRGAIRGEAYKKLARISVETPVVGTSGSGDFIGLLKANSPKGKLVISLNELEILLALCDATAAEMTATTRATTLVDKLSSYLISLPSQQFAEAAINSLGKQSPWMVLGERLTLALANLAFKFDNSLLDPVVATLHRFVETFFSNHDLDLPDYLTLLGVMSALSTHARIFTASPLAYKVFHMLDACIDSVDFLNDVETFSSSVYSQAELRHYLDHETVADFSPILFLQKLSKLVVSITNSVLGNTKKPLMDYLLSRVYSQNFGDEQSNSANGDYLSPNGNGQEDSYGRLSRSGNGTANGTANGTVNGTANGTTNGTLSSIISSTGSLLDGYADELFNLSESQLDIIKKLAENALQKLEFLDRGETYIVYSTIARLRLGYLAKSELMLVVACGSVTDTIEVSAAKKIFQSSIGIFDVMLDYNLGTAVFQLGSLLVSKVPSVGSSLTRAFTSFVANPNLSASQCQVVSKSVGLASKVLSQDAVVTTIYALTNLLFVSNDGLQLHVRSRRGTGIRNSVTTESLLRKVEGNPNRLIRNNTLLRKSVASTERENNGLKEEEVKKVCANAVTAISEVVAACDDQSVSALAVTILSQKTVKLNTTVAPTLMDGLVSCAPYLPEREFIIVVRLLHKISFDAYEAKNNKLLEIVLGLRSALSHKLTQENPLYFVYLREMLSAIISKGDVQVLDHHRPHNEISAIGDQISIYLKPLADLLPDVHDGAKPLKNLDSHTSELFRNIWFNMVVHGYSLNSTNTQLYATELERIAFNTPPLASARSWNRTETSLELNTVLRRGSSNHNVKDHRHIVGDISEVSRTLSYSKLMFLAAALFLESLRVKTGDCHTILEYYSDPSMKTSGIDKYLGYIAFKINKDFIALVFRGADKEFTAENIARQLTQMLILCCYGLEDLQDAAIQCCDLLINKVPSSLCHHRSLFALFDLLTLLHNSVVDAEVNQYEPTFLYTAKRTGIQLKLPDSYTWRNETFTRLHEKAIGWLNSLLLKCSFDTKSLIQSYVSEIDYFHSSKTIEFGVSFALEMAGNILANDRELSHLPRHAKKLAVNLLPALVSQLSWRSNFLDELQDRVSFHSAEGVEIALQDLRQQVLSLRELLEDKDNHVPIKDITDILSEIAGFALVQDSNLAELVRYLVEIPFLVFDSATMRAATNIWGALMKERPNLSILVLSEITKGWERSISLKQGIFCTDHDVKPAEFCKMEYSPSDFKHVNKLANSVNHSFQPHSMIIQLLSSNFEATMNQSDHLLKIFTRFINIGLRNIIYGSLHPFARYIRFELVDFAFEVLNYHIKLESRSCQRLTELIFDSALYWFKARAGFPFGNDLLKIKADYTLLKEVATVMSAAETFKSEILEQKKILLMFFMDDEISDIGVWLNPTQPSDSHGSYIANHITGDHISTAFKIDPQLAVNLAQRYKLKNLDELLQKLIYENPLPAIKYPDAVQYFIGINAGSTMPNHYLLYWEPLSPIDAITLFLPPFCHSPYVLQFTMRSLEFHDVNLTFFYVPQIVQSLRYDEKGYVKRFILETAHISQLFAHQIIWNMLANSYKDEDSTDPDSLKPTLDEIQQLMLEGFSEEDLLFYKKEFGFFNEVTSISGKLKPYIKKSKAEKKIKIDEEMARIAVQPGVYLPSNPDGVLVDINRKSGKPLQSHAKAPFMATFKIKREVDDIDEYGRIIKVPVEKWQSAIFKVGDDCRQDVLALQLISVFRTIWLNAGLDLFVFPYRVTATAPGCGVIDVLPNSTSRDMLGREAVNGLYEYFTTKFGPESSIEFQQARNNLIRSLAAYSIISFLLQFKDRHNGNIMYDDQGHIMHIDFGFCFDIVPGGVKFEAVPFKLTREMVMVLGGSNSTQAYHWFEELCIKGFLACRLHMETIVRCITPMLDSGLPCFKETTIKKLRKRFVPNKLDKDAAIYFRGLIHKSYESFYTTGYDEFQRLTNGIPY